jgi:dihydropteroate synthase
MGVLNVTPDSFSDGGQLHDGKTLQADALYRRAEAMVSAGAAVLDIGGESTRPGAEPVSAAEEADRVLPALTQLRQRFDVVLSLDTSTPLVMREGALLGAGMINDVRALTRPGALDAAASSGLPVCLMHMQGDPQTMQQAPSYADVVADVKNFLQQRIGACEAAGIERTRLLLDPGFGFGKTLAHNLTLLQRLGELQSFDLPILAGLSRKSMIGKITGRPDDDRLAASVSLAVMAAERGARLLRVHDVKETADALAMVKALEELTQ